MRALALALLLAAPAVASGCLGATEGNGERLAQPTDTPITVPRATPTAKPPTFNTSDPGYQVKDPWKLGDGWDYESDKGKRQVRVLDTRLVDGSTKYLLETKQLSLDGKVQSTTRSWVEARTFMLLNETTDGAVTDRYDPGHPLRFWRNGTAAYAHERTDASGAMLRNESVTLYSRFFPQHKTLQFPWGYVEAKVVEHLVVVRGPDGSRTEGTITYWVHQDYLNAVQFKLASGETYSLTAVKAGDFRRGQLAR